MYLRNVGPRSIFNVEETQTWVSSNCEARMSKELGVAFGFLFRQEDKAKKTPAILFVMDVSLAA